MAIVVWQREFYGPRYDSSSSSAVKPSRSRAVGRAGNSSPEASSQAPMRACRAAASTIDPATEAFSRLDLADHRDLHQPVAALAEPAGRARAFRADDEDKAARSGRPAASGVASGDASSPATHTPSAFSASSACTRLPTSAILQVLDRAGRCVDNRRRHPGRPAAGQDNAGHAHRLGGPQQRAEVLHILQVVERQDRAGLRARLSSSVQVDVRGTAAACAITPW